MYLHLKIHVHYPTIAYIPCNKICGHVLNIESRSLRHNKDMQSYPSYSNPTHLRMQENHVRSTSMLHAIEIHFLKMHYTSTPTSHNSFSSSTKGCKYTSIATNPSLTLQGSDENCKCMVSDIFHASKSAGCCITPSSVRPLTCHFIELARSGDRNSRCNLGFKRNHRRIFTAFFFPLLDEALVPVTDASFVFHLETLQQGHASR